MNQANRADALYGQLRAAEVRIFELEAEAIRRREDLDDAIRRLGIENTKRREAEEWSAAWERTAEQLEDENDSLGTAGMRLKERIAELERVLGRLKDAAREYLLIPASDYAYYDDWRTGLAELNTAIAEAHYVLGKDGE